MARANRFCRRNSLATRVPRRSPRGFTLIEAALALLVVALLLVAALATDGLVTQSRVREFCRESSALISTLELYRARYGALPGDDPSAGSRWPGVVSGNGNGVVGGRFDRSAPGDTSALTSGADDDEPLLAWWHLRRAGLLVGAAEGAGAVTPPRIGGLGAIGVQTGAYGFVGPVACSADVSGALAEGIDRARDDGSPHTGTVRSGTAIAQVAERYAHDARYVVCVSLDGSAGPSVLAAATGASVGGSETPVASSGNADNSGAAASQSDGAQGQGATGGTGSAGGSGGNGAGGAATDAGNGNSNTSGNGNGNGDGNGNGRGNWGWLAALWQAWSAWR
jgi:prepilin-type N-terminal cleavage/methylation domain-containing protein